MLTWRIWISCPQLPLPRFRARDLHALCKQPEENVRLGLLQLLGVLLYFTDDYIQLCAFKNSDLCEFVHIRCKDWIQSGRHGHWSVINILLHNKYLTNTTVENILWISLCICLNIKPP